MKNGSTLFTIYMSLLFMCLGALIHHEVSRKSYVPSMDRALAACVEACNNDPITPHQVGAGEQNETYVDCYCKGYKQYDYHPSGQ